MLRLHASMAESLTRYKNIKSSAIIHGRKYEAVARDAYSKDQSVSVNESGIVVSLDVPYVGCSPDCLVGDDPDSVPYLQFDIHGKLLLKVNHDYY